MEEQLKTTHEIRIDDSASMSQIEDRSVDLIVTSPPYPMIQMWDHQFSQKDPEIAEALSKGKCITAFERIHRQLDLVWKEAFRILKPGGVTCINIGDATRTINGHFQLFPNHARIITALMKLGFSQLPTILWRKPTNAPNKFMGSGMLPAGAYVTLEHEYIVIFRKGAKRRFNEEQKKNRRRSAYFWEERNLWFSDVWFDLRGTRQKLNGMTKRSGAYPLELPYRLINMYSLAGDVVVDPFLGSGTTMLAAMCTARNSIGYEIDQSLHSAMLEKIADAPAIANTLIQDRLEAHTDFINERRKSKGEPKHVNHGYGFPVITRQEQNLRLAMIESIQYQSSTKFQMIYGDTASTGQRGHSQPGGDTRQTDPLPRLHRGRQMKIF
jgi:DNA modification methylase